jgi:hypothetical protein
MSELRMKACRKEGTHELKGTEEGMNQERQRNRASDGYSPTGECRGRAKDRQRNGARNEHSRTGEGRGRVK